MAASSDIDKIFKNAAEKKRVLQDRVQVLMAEIAAKQAEMNATLQAIDRIDVTLKGIRELGEFGDEPVALPDSKPERMRAETGLTRAGHGNKRVFFEQIVRDILVKNGAPMGTSEVLRAFQDSGHKLEGSDPWKLASNLLWAAKRDGRLIHKIGVGYWPSDVPNIGLGYVPPPGGVAPPLEVRRLKPKIKPPKVTGGGSLGQPNALTPEQAAKARELRAQGLSYAAIGKQLGAGSQSTIMRYLREENRATRRAEKETTHHEMMNARDALYHHPEVRGLVTGDDTVTVRVSPPILSNEAARQDIVQRVKAYMPHIASVEFVAG